MTSDEEVSVWAWTKDYDMIVVEGFDDEALYGLQNRHTYVIEVTEPIFSNAINYLIELQIGHDSASELIDAEGAVMMDDISPVSLIKKEKMH